MPKLIIGCGYVGCRVARRWLEQGDQVSALTRKPARAAEFAELGISPIVGDVAQSLQFPPVDAWDTILYAVGFDRRSEYSMEDVYVDGLARVLDQLPERIGRLIYVSSTGVYGQTDGEWVDEDSPCRPQRAGGKVVLAAERLLAQHRLGPRAIVLRLAGIYGPDRVPRIRDVREGNPLPAASGSYLNLIHVDDAVTAILAAERTVEPPARFVISDGCPVLRAEFYRELAGQLGAATPQFAAAAHPGAAAQRDLSSKRVRNARMLDELVARLRYPSYREGLASVVDAE